MALQIRVYAVLLWGSLGALGFLLGGCGKKKTISKHSISSATEVQDSEVTSSETDSEESFETLKAKAESYKAAHKNREAINTYQKLLSLYRDHKEALATRMKLADLYFDQGEYKYADSEYKKFKKARPSQADYASYRSVVCQFNQTLNIDRDPTPLKKTIKRCKKHLQHEIYGSGAYVQDVRDILYTCERKLIDREVYTFNFYLDHNKLASAHNRLKELESYTEKHKDMEPRILYLQSKLALKQGDASQAYQAVAKLEQDFATSQYTDMAKRLVVSRNLEQARAEKNYLL